MSKSLEDLEKEIEIVKNLEQFNLYKLYANKHNINEELLFVLLGAYNVFLSFNFEKFNEHFTNRFESIDTSTDRKLINYVKLINNKCLEMDESKKKTNNFLINKINKIEKNINSKIDDIVKNNLNIELEIPENELVKKNKEKIEDNINQINELKKKIKTINQNLEKYKSNIDKKYNEILKNYNELNNKYISLKNEMNNKIKNQENKINELFECNIQINNQYKKEIDLLKKENKNYNTKIKKQNDKIYELEEFIKKINNNIVIKNAQSNTELDDKINYLIGYHIQNINQNHQFESYKMETYNSEYPLLLAN